MKFNSTYYPISGNPRTRGGGEATYRLKQAAHIFLFLFLSLSPFPAAHPFPSLPDPGCTCIFSTKTENAKRHARKPYLSILPKLHKPPPTNPPTYVLPPSEQTGHSLTNLSNLLTRPCPVLSGPASITKHKQSPPPGQGPEGRNSVFVLSLSLSLLSTGPGPI